MQESNLQKDSHHPRSPRSRSVSPQPAHKTHKKSRSSSVESVILPSVNTSLMEKMDAIFSFMRDTNSTFKESNQRLEKLKADQFTGFQPHSTPAATSAKRSKILRKSRDAPRRYLLPLGHHHQRESSSEAEDQEGSSPQEEYFEQEEVSSSNEATDRPTLGVSFASPNIQRLSMDNILESWQVLRDGMALGQEPGSVVFTDGTVYGAQSIKLDVQTYECPISVSEMLYSSYL